MRRSPRWAEWLLSLVAGREAAWVLAELEAEHAARAAGGREREASRWYRLQVLRSAVPLLRGRLGRLRRRHEPIRNWRGATTMDTVWQDVRYALRSLVRAPGFAITAVLTVALGVGAATTVFGLFEAVLLRSLPFGEPDRLVAVESWRPATGDEWSVAYGDFRDWREAEVFSSVAIYMPQTVDFTGAGEPTRVQGSLVSPEFFAALGTRAQLGRLLEPRDWEQSETPMVISHALWQSEFGGGTDVIGRTVRVSSTPMTIVGVLEPRGGLPSEAEAWAPFREGMFPPSVLDRRDNFMFQSVARLRTDRTLEQTQAQLATLATRVEQENDRRSGVSVKATPIRAWMIGDTVPLALMVLLGAVTFVLLIGCANVAGLMLARASARSREFAVRTALGSGRIRLVRQVLTESGVIALAGCAAGTLFAWWGVRLVVAMAPRNVYGLAQAGVNPTVLGVAILASAVSAMLFGTAPALYAIRAHPAGALAEGSQRAGFGRGRQRLQRILVGGQLALSLVLLTGAGLLVGSLLRLTRGDAGVRTDHLLTVPLALPGARYPDAASRLAFFDELVTRVEAMPGVESATLTSYVPLGGTRGGLIRAYLAEGTPEPPAGTETVGPWTVTGSEHFSTFGTPLLAGREFDARDTGESTPVMIVNQRFADVMFGAVDPIGKRVRSWRDENVLREIVGVVRDVRYFGASDEIRPLVYVPLAQAPSGRMTLVVRTTGEPTALAGALREVTATLDPELALSELRTMEEVHAASLAGSRFNAVLLGAFAGLALVLAAIGLYGLLAYGVSQRLREIGVRMALGARRGSVLALVLRNAIRVVLPGVTIGLVGAAATTRLLRNLLFEIDPLDPLTIGGVATLLVVVALLASAIPAHRASRVDPARILREG